MKTTDITKYLEKLSEIYSSLGGEPIEVALCGGAALNLLGYVERVTKDIDIVSPDQLPEKFHDAVKIVSQHFGLKSDWINQGPIDLLRMGLPEGFFSRCEKLQFNQGIIFLITSRLDQIHFKLYASADRGGYHLQDLRTLKPTDDELEMATLWCFEHDVSDVFKTIMIDLLNKNGWTNVGKRISK